MEPLPPPIPPTPPPQQYSQQYSPPPIMPTQLYCSACGYNLSGAAIGGACPKCGLYVSDSLYFNRPLRTSGMAIACMVTGILSIMLCPLVGIIALILCVFAMNDIKSGGYGGGSKGMAITGLVTGLIGLAITALVIIALIMDVN